MTDSLVAFPLTDEQAAVQRLARELAETVFRERAARWDEREEYRMFTIAGGTVQMLRNLVANRIVGRLDQRDA
jgi:alkylation response protein AidB-like acyl-CoA dehydrogenase